MVLAGSGTAHADRSEARRRIVVEAGVGRREQTQVHCGGAAGVCHAADTTACGSGDQRTEHLIGAWCGGARSHFGVALEGAERGEPAAPDRVVEGSDIMAAVLNPPGASGVDDAEDLLGSGDRCQVVAGVVHPSAVQIEAAQVAERGVAGADAVDPVVDEQARLVVAEGGRVSRPADLDDLLAVQGLDQRFTQRVVVVQRVVIRRSNREVGSEAGLGCRDRLGCAGVEVVQRGDPEAVVRGDA